MSGENNPDEVEKALGTVGLALSGGGARAIAFHLGCLRGLHDAGLLSEIDAISAVSGGSVIAALYCSHNGDFESFERRVRNLLSRGFVRPAFGTVFTTSEGAKALFYFLLTLTERVVAFPLKIAMGRIAAKRRWKWPRESLFIRVASRTTILRRVFAQALANRSLTDLRPDRPKLVIIACELRAKAAFYFTAEKIHCWRYGSASSKNVALSDAVAASAAYPLFLPALDQMMDFQKREKKQRHRITLTDGGVYDNLGLSPFWPDRDASISLDIGSFDRVIACRAGYTLEVSEPAALLPARIHSAFESVFARAQNLATNRLFDLAKAGRYKGILLPYLGQDDSKLAFAPPDLVAGDSVAGYPTNFGAMSVEWIERLTKRGEQLVLALLRENWSEFVTSATTAEVSPGQVI